MHEQENVERAVHISYLGPCTSKSCCCWRSSATLFSDLILNFSSVIFAPMGSFLLALPGRSSLRNSLPGTAMPLALTSCGRFICSCCCASRARRASSEMGLLVISSFGSSHEIDLRLSGDPVSDPLRVLRKLPPPGLEPRGPFPLLVSPSRDTILDALCAALASAGVEASSAARIWSRERSCCFQRYRCLASQGAVEPPAAPSFLLTKPWVLL